MKSAAVLFFLTSLVPGGSLPFVRDGLIDTPGISILEHTEIRVGTVFVMYSFENAAGDTDSEFAVGGHLEFGFFDVGQLGLCYLGKGGISAHIKIRPIRESLDLPGIVLGVQNITGQQDYEFYENSDGTLYSNGRNQNFSAYIVLSKDLRYISGIPVDISLGYGIGRFQPAEPDSGSTSSTFIPGLFGSIRIRALKSTRFMIEWDGRDLNVGTEYDISSRLTAQAAIVELEELFGSSDERDRTDVMQNMKVGFGLEFTFGPLYNPSPAETRHLTELDRRNSLAELEELRRQAEEELRRMQELLDNR